MDADTSGLYVKVAGGGAGGRAFAGIDRAPLSCIEHEKQQQCDVTGHNAGEVWLASFKGVIRSKDAR